jgi:hypothetical protein
MQDSKKWADQGKRRGVRSRKVIPDYTGDYYYANVLAKRIQNYWQRTGNNNVRTWVETDITYSGNKIYSVRSNITYKV